jgi:hypothetical protein
MRNRRVIVNRLVLYFVVACAASNSIAAPGSQPSSGELDALVKQLGSNGSSERRQARDELVKLGQTAVPRLEAAARAASNAEIRGEIQVVLKRIAEQNESGPTLITLHAYGTGPEIFQAIGKQAGVRIEPYDSETWAGKPSPAFSVDYERVPFWEAVSRAGQQCGVRPTPWYRWSPLNAPGHASDVRVIPGEIQLERIDGDAWRHYVGVACGLFYVRAYVFQPRRRDPWFVRLEAISEPKLRPVFWVMPSVKAVDDRGRVLKLARPRDADHVAEMWDQSAQDGCDFYPERGGSRIAELKSSTQVFVATALQKYELPDLSRAGGIVWNWNGARIELAEFETMKEGGYRLTMNVARGKLDEAQFYDLYRVIHTVPVRLLDANDRRLESNGGSETLLQFNGVPVDHFGVVRTFAREARFPGGDANPGAPDHLKWELPTRLRAYDVPVVLKDIPVSGLSNSTH